MDHFYLQYKVGQLYFGTPSKRRQKLLRWSQTQSTTKVKCTQDPRLLKQSKLKRLFVSRYVIFFVSRCRMQSGYEVAEVFITTLAAATRLPMTAATVAGARVFSHEIQEWRPPVTFTFWASVVETVPNYSFRLCDSLASDQLWKSASDGLFTDIKFHVGERTFHAHKAIVAARSPVMMAMFACDMTESRTNSVKIDDFDPVVFERFLSFLYTGTLDRTMSQREELYAIADKYQVDTLKNLCQPAPAELDASELTSLILFL